MTDDAHPQRIGIVGLGLIGGSIGLALRDPAREIIGCDRSPKSEKVAVQRFCVDRLAPFDEVAKAEVVFIAVPPGAVIATAEELLKHKAEQTVLTDCASVKTEVSQWAARKKLTHFVPGHPMAGHEKGGAEYASAWLFRDARWILTPDRKASKGAVSAVENLVKAVGAVPIRLDSSLHDRHVAILSHLPHALAAVLVLMAADLQHLEVAAGSWRDVTRVGGVDPELWTQILIGNRLELAKVLEEFELSLKTMTDMLRDNDVTAMKMILEQAQLAKVKQDGRLPSPAVAQVAKSRRRR